MKKYCFVLLMMLFFTTLSYARIKNKQLGFSGGDDDWEKVEYEKELRVLKQIERLKK